MSLLVPIYFVDAFTTNNNSAFTGNPAAVCLLDYDDELPDDIKQKIASEINLSETAFVSFGWTKGERLPAAEGSQLHRRTIRWFTPTTEVPLCGHATVASTKALVEAQLTDLFLDPNVKNIAISFESKYNGKLGAVFSKETGRITLNFPSNPSFDLNKQEHCDWIDKMIATTFGEKVSPATICDVQYSPSTQILLLRLHNNGRDAPGDLLKQISPDFKKMMQIDHKGFIRDIIVTIRGEAKVGEKSTDGKPHFYSRFFAPWHGIDEDPVTGLAHTVLTPYWTHELTKCLKEPGSHVGTLLARQHSTRGGNLHCTLIGDRVNLAGEARVTIKGHFSV